MASPFGETVVRIERVGPSFAADADVARVMPDAVRVGFDGGEFGVELGDVGHGDFASIIY